MTISEETTPSAAPVRDQSQMAPIAAVMYASAGSVVGLSLLLPHPPQMNTAALLGAALVGPLAAVFIWLLRDRLAPWFFHLTTAAGTVLAGLCVYWSGEAASSYSFLWLWVAVFSAYFFTPIALAAHLGFAAAVYALVLDAHPQPDPDLAAHWVVTGVCITLASAIISSLVHSRRRLEDERERLLVHTLELARTDPLTGLLNRRAWRDLLDAELSRSLRRGSPVCVAMLDLDHFKRFNDDHGHVAGDAFLQQLAAEWRGAVRPSDTIARYGGEEFSLLLPDCDVNAAIDVIERLRECVPLGERCSAGVACWDGEETPLALITRADGLLYEAKDSGRDRLVVAIDEIAPAAPVRG
jgi:diguanylate cyclase (GGDEF)-like protein